MMNAETAFRKGRQCEHGTEGTAKDAVKALHLYQEAAEQGHVDAMLAVAQLLLHNASIAALSAGGTSAGYTAVDWLRRAQAERPAGRSAATTARLLGNCFLYGKGGAARDLKLALPLLREAARLSGDTTANVPLATCLLAQVDTSDGDNHEQDRAAEVEAMLLLNAAHATGKSSEATFLLARCFADGRGGQTPDRTRSVQLYIQASAAGNQDAKAVLAHHYAVGDGVPQDTVAAFRDAMTAARLKSAHGHYVVGLLERRDVRKRGFVKAQAQAFQAFEVAAKLGHAAAATEVGHAFFFGRGTLRDEARCFAAYESAAQTGDVDAMYYLGWCYAHGVGAKSADTALATAWYRRGAMRSHSPSLVMYGVALLTGSGVPVADPEQGIAMLLKALPSVAAEYNLGACAQRGYAGAVLPQNHPAADVPSILNRLRAVSLGEEIPDGLPVYIADCTEAVMLHALASSLAIDTAVSAAAAYELGLCFARGRGVPQDDAAAIHWWGVAAAKDFSVATVLLGDCHRYGQNGVLIDLGQARMWYEQAAELGDVDAMRRLCQLATEDPDVLAYRPLSLIAWYAQLMALNEPNAAEPLQALVQKYASVLNGEGESLLHSAIKHPEYLGRPTTLATLLDYVPWEFRDRNGKLFLDYCLSVDYSHPHVAALVRERLNQVASSTSALGPRPSTDPASAKLVDPVSRWLAVHYLQMPGDGPPTDDSILAFLFTALQAQDIHGIVSSVQVIARVFPSHLATVLGSHAKKVKEYYAGRTPPLSPLIASSLQIPSQMAATQRLRAIASNESDTCSLATRACAGVCAALLMHDQGFIMDAANMAALHLPACNNAVVALQWQLRASLQEGGASPASKDAERQLLQSATAYVVMAGPAAQARDTTAAASTYPDSWLRFAMVTLQRVVQTATASTMSSAPGLSARTPDTVASGSTSSSSLSLKERWDLVMRSRPASETKAANAILAMTGLSKVKDRVVALYEEMEVMRDQGRDLTSLRLHARFEGNPGTGKSTVGKLYGQMLCECGVLAAPTTSGALQFERVTGAQLADIGTKEVKNKLQSLLPGMLFVDEAHQLDPHTNLSGRQVLRLLMDEMEEKAGKLVIVIAGYEKDINKLSEADPGLPSRFPQRFIFEDYSDNELASILIESFTRNRFRLEDEKWARVAARRVGRGRGSPGFGNGRNIRNLYEATLSRQASRLVEERRESGRPADVRLIKRNDLLGPKANRDTIVQTCTAYQKLQEMEGLAKVKRSVEEIISTAASNADYEERGEPLVKLVLNRVFMGNPGTGKTTVAKLLANILQHLGLLTKGEVLYRTASDFVGTAVGESAKLTSAIVESARGSVLVIDEAYGLDPGGGIRDSSGVNPYKQDVINTLVEKISGTSADDMAVFLLGYTDPMRKLLGGDSNGGLQRRFNIDEALEFEDYDDDELARILQKTAKAHEFTVDFDATQAALKILQRRRALPNFGNAGEVLNLFNSAQLRMQSRRNALIAGGNPVATQRELIAADFEQANNAVPPTDEELGPELAQVRKDLANRVARNKVLGRQPMDNLDFGFAFVGPPGTGKTTSGRLMGRVLHALGALQSADLVETRASDFLTGFAQQAGKRTEEIFKSALGKVLFIDEAYSLLSEDPRGEVLNNICAFMTSKEYAGKVVVAIAGYEADIAALLASNGGLSSRFERRVRFAPWTVEKASKVLRAITVKDGLEFDAEADHCLLNQLAKLANAPGWSSGRDVASLAKALYGRVAVGDKVTMADVVDVVDGMIRSKEEFEKDKRSMDRRGIAVNATWPEMLPAATATLTASAIPTVACCAVNKSEEVGESSDSSGASVALDGADPWRLLRQVHTGDNLDSLEPRSPAVLESLIAQGIQENEARKQLEAWEEHQKELARLVEEERRRHEEEARKQRELEEQARKAAEEEERRRLEAEAQRIREAQAQRARVQAKLRSMGICPAGYQWVRQQGGWRCTAGGHFVSDSQLGDC